jgi:hypothetical protein
MLVREAGAGQVTELEWATARRKEPKGLGLSGRKQEAGQNHSF